jgi:hypothetical protein
MEGSKVNVTECCLHCLYASICWRLLFNTSYKQLYAYYVRNIACRSTDAYIAHTATVRIVQITPGKFKVSINLLRGDQRLDGKVMLRAQESWNC